MKFIDPKKLKSLPKKITRKKTKTSEPKLPEENEKKKLLGFIPIKNKKQLVIAGVVSAVVIFLAVMGIGIYGYNWEDDTTYAVSGVVPYPAAIVNGKVVTYHDYLQNLRIIKKYQSEFKKVDFKTKEGKETLAAMRQDTLDRLAEDAIVTKEAKRLKVELSEKELDESYAELIKSNGGDKSFAEVLDKYYGLTPQEFKVDIYKVRLLRQKLMEKFSSDESLNADAKKKAEEVLAKAKAGEDFAKLAKEYSQDTTASAGGDLGTFGKGKMVPEFETAAFALKEGQISGIVKTVYGYHIIKVTDVKGENITASHILIKTKDFDSWLETEVKAAKIRNFIKGSIG